MAASHYTFKARNSVLLNLEADYTDFVISCRHKDILRAGNTKHFTSCYRTGGIMQSVPYQLCTRHNTAILGVKDKAGDWLWRAFVELNLRRNTWTLETENWLTVYKLYGNYPVNIKEVIASTLQKGTLRTNFVEFDAV